MSNQTKTVIGGLGVVLFAVILLVSFPPITRFVEGVAMDLRRFWWLVLIVALMGWAGWVIRNRNPG